MNRWMDKEDVCMCVCVCIYIYIYIWNGILLIHKKEWYAICSLMDGPRDNHMKWISHTEKYKYTKKVIWCHISGVSKNDTNELICKIEIDS